MLLVTAAIPALADEARVSVYTTKLRSVRATEVAREAAKLVTAEKSDARVSAAADAVTAAVTVNSPSAPVVVGNISKAAPETAATAAATAVKAQPKLAAAITKGAVSAAPGELPAIITAMCKAQPSSFYSIGVAAAQAAPKSGDKVLTAVTAALPSLKPLVERSQADFAAAKRPASIALILKHAQDMLAAISRDSKQDADELLALDGAIMKTKLASLAATPPPPVQQPPFVGGGGTPGEITTAGTSTAEAPPGGRVYSTP